METHYVEILEVGTTFLQISGCQFIDVQWHSNPSNISIECQ